VKKLLLTLLAIIAFSVAVNAAVKGDVNDDGAVNSADITTLYSWLLNEETDGLVYGDVNGDGDITSADITFVYDILLGIVEPPAPVTEYTVNGVKFSMVEVEGGTYMMGSELHAGNAYPSHEVTVSTFSIGQTEVTQELWVAVMGTNPSFFNEYGNADLHSNHDSYDSGINLQRPVDYVNISDCQAFVAKLNEMTGKNFRIPTEAEWEFAARGGNLSQGYLYAGSDSINDVAWYKLNMPSTTTYTEGWGSQSVATKAPNELGIYDMSGNVEEWCMDWFATYSTDLEPQTNPTGPETGTYRVIRGGKWGSTAAACRVFMRSYNNPDSRGNSRGLRIAM